MVSITHGELPKEHAVDTHSGEEAKGSCKWITGVRAWPVRRPQTEAVFYWAYLISFYMPAILWQLEETL